MFYLFYTSRFCCCLLRFLAHSKSRGLLLHKVVKVHSPFRDGSDLALIVQSKIKLLLVDLVMDFALLCMVEVDRRNIFQNRYTVTEGFFCAANGDLYPLFHFSVFSGWGRVNCVENMVLLVG